MSKQQAKGAGGDGGVYQPNILADRWLTTNQLCEFFQVSRSTIWRWVQKGRLSAGSRPADGHLRYSATQLEADIAAGRLKLPVAEKGERRAGKSA